MRNRAIATLAALAASASLVLAPQAHAAEPNAVFFGDSVPANPSIVDFFAGKVIQNPATVALPEGVNINHFGCGSDNQMTNAFGRGAGLPTANFTCAGASLASGGRHVIDQINEAAAAGQLGAHTKQVAILAGANDTYAYNGKEPLDVIFGRIHNSMRDAVMRAKELAPNADIKIVDYPTIAPDGNVCLIRVAPGQAAPIHLQAMGDYERGLTDVFRNVAHETGVKYVDSKAPTLEHGMCSADPWYAGLIDFGAGPHQLPVHATDAGLNAVGEFAGRA